MPFIQANGIKTYYETAGRGDPLVLLHNDAMSLQVWWRLIPDLAAKHRTLAYDRRGHGHSEVPPQEAPYTAEVLAEDLRALLDGVKIPRTDVFGYSGGAIPALAFALAYPKRVRRMILAEPPILGLRRNHPIDTGGLSGDGIARILEECGVAAALENWFQRVLSPPKASALLRSRHRKLLLSRAPWISEGIIRSAEAFNPNASLVRVCQPVLLIQGQNTHRHFSSVIDVLAVRLPHARRLVLPGREHVDLLKPSPRLLTSLQDFLHSESPTEQTPTLSLDRTAQRRRETRGQGLD